MSNISCALLDQGRKARPNLELLGGTYRSQPRRSSSREVRFCVPYEERLKIFDDPHLALQIAVVCNSISTRVGLATLITEETNGLRNSEL